MICFKYDESINKLCYKYVLFMFYLCFIYDGKLFIYDANMMTEVGLQLGILAIIEKSRPLLPNYTTSRM